MALERSSLARSAAETAGERAGVRLERGTESGDSGTEIELGIVQNFRLWRLRFGQPVFCPVCLCNSSCKNYADACTLNSEARVLGYYPAAAKLLGVGPSGCGGACLKASSEVGCCPD